MGGIFGMTMWADILTASMVVVNDIRWKEQLATSPAQFYRAKSLLIQRAYPMLSKPMQLLFKLQNGMVAPKYDEFEWSSTEESIQAESTAVETGKTGFTLCSVVLLKPLDNGSVAYAPYPQAVYDPDTGVVTFPRQTRQETRYLLDFYTDGSFPDLTPKQMDLMALAVAEVWREHFDNDWLNEQPKIHDESFDTVNEANYLDKSSKKQQVKRIAFNDALKDYEQLCQYAAVLGGSGKRIVLV